MATIALVDVCKRFEPGRTALADRLWPFGPRTAAPNGRTRARGAPFTIQNLNLTIPHGRTLVLLGPSGCGKTTLLRIIAGLIAPDSGQVLFGGKDVRELAPGERRIGMVFQSYALYPHLTSKTNILSYFYFRKKTPALDAEAKAKYKRTSELMGVEIDYLLDRMPTNLSGGEKQRVALARCITRDPALFLLDEPFSNLDQKLREKYRLNLKTLLNQFHITTVYVTHDQNEAMILADQIAIMDVGRVEQVGTYEQLYTRPKSIFVAEFLSPHSQTGSINLLEGERVQPELSDTLVGVRPEDIDVSTTPETAGRVSIASIANRASIASSAGRASIPTGQVGIAGTVTNRINLPVQGTAILEIRVGERQVTARVPIALIATTNDTVWLHLQRYHVFSVKTGVRIRSVPD